MGHIPEERTAHCHTVEDTDMNTHDGIIMSIGFSYQVFDIDVLVGYQHKKIARGNVIKQINNRYDVAQNIKR